MEQPGAHFYGVVRAQQGEVVQGLPVASVVVVGERTRARRQAHDATAAGAQLRQSVVIVADQEQIRSPRHAGFIYCVRREAVRRSRRNIYRTLAETGNEV